MKRLLLLLCLAACVPLWGDVLWNQPVDPLKIAYYVNQEFFPDVPTYSTYVVSDIVVPAGGWTVTSGTWYGGCWNGCYSLPTIPVVLNVFSLAGSLPGAGDDPTAGTQYTASISFSGAAATIQLTGLSLGLPAGSYWIGITPVASFASDGQLGFRQTTNTLGYLDALRNPGGGFGLGTDWMPVSVVGAGTDAAFMLEGTAGGGAIPEPSTWVLGVTGMAILAWFRRKR